MRWPIRNQILLPFAVLLTVAICLTAGASAWHASQQRTQQKLQHLMMIVRSLSDSSFPVSQDIAERIGGLTSGELIAVDDRGIVYASTLTTDENLLRQLSGLSVSVPAHEAMNPGDSIPAKDAMVDMETNSPQDAFRSIRWHSSTYAVAVIPRRFLPRPGRLYVLIPQQELDEIGREAVMVPVAIGALTLIGALAVSILLSKRLARRIERVRQLLATIEAGGSERVDVSGRNDEVRDLLMSANHLADQLEQLRQRMQTTERLNLLSQLSGGLAHQLRNSIAGARLAVQLHQQQCDHDDNQMLVTAVAQLKLTEEQVRAVLSLRNHGKTANSSTSANASRQSSAGSLTAVPAESLLREVADLVRPHCEHRRTELIVSGDPSICLSLPDPDAFRGAMLNLIMNAIEAAGIGGRVEAEVLRHNEQTVLMEIRDSGSGFPEDIAEQLGGAFVTSKPDGIGLGLTIARHAVSQANGELKLSRQNQLTVVAVLIPQAVGTSSETTHSLPQVR
ncbi:MAG: HAMP domain-containing histidine kinase [Planctomycetaceae bacterium]|nr:HAMP domain-containing histidine kinase [Planctomycetaceae bacterium]